MARISIIVPIYNVEQYLTDCLESIHNQNFSDWECILVDDGSLDGSGRVCDYYASIDNRFIVVHSENRGVSVARNIGIALATSDYILFVDGDDGLSPDACSLCYKAINNSDYDCCIFGFSNGSDAFDGNHNIVIYGNDMDSLKKSIVAKDTDLYTNSYHVNVDSPWGKVFRKSLITKYSIKFPVGMSRSQDAIFCLYYYEHSNKISIDSHIIYKYTENDNSVCRRCSDTSVRMMPRIIEENLKFVQDFHALDSTYKESVVNRAYMALLESESLYFFNKNNPKSFGVLYKEYTTLLDNTIVQSQFLKSRIFGAKSLKYSLHRLLVKRPLRKLYFIIRKFFIGR